MTFKSIHTAVGLKLMTQTEATGSKIRLTHMAVGDGNGYPVTPNEGMTTLVRERYRATVNRVWQDPVIPNKFSAEMIIPHSVGGFVLREIGVFDSNGNLFVVGNLPNTYKPTGADGSYSDTVIRVDFMVTNSSIVELIIDPNVIVATHQWVMNTITICALLPGGTTGQVLRKKSNGCGDIEWADPNEVNVIVDMVEETQTLAASQVVVDWSTVTNAGLAVYVDGVRLRGDEWTSDPAIHTRITLATSYPAGSRITGTQNEPASSLPDPLEKSLNLADVPDKALARVNLDVISKSETRQMAQPGLVGYYARSTAPDGWLKANGAEVSRVAYADLFAAIGTLFGAGDGFNTFNVPDLRGEFLRSWDDRRGVDVGRSLGSAQDDDNKAHAHGASSKDAGEHNHSQTTSQYAEDGSGNPWGSGNPSKPEGSVTWRTGSAGSHHHEITVNSSGGNEARPRNVALLACIKF